jgi:hypothetical protein
METLRVAYALAKKNDGAPGIDGVTFDDIEKQGVEAFLETRKVAAALNAPSRAKTFRISRSSP